MANAVIPESFNDLFTTVAFSPVATLMRDGGPQVRAAAPRRAEGGAAPRLEHLVRDRVGDRLGHAQRLCHDGLPNAADCPHPRARLRRAFLGPARQLNPD